MFICTHIYIYIYICIYIYNIYIIIWRYKRTHVHAHICMHAHTHVLSLTHTILHTRSTRMRTRGSSRSGKNFRQVLVPITDLCVECNQRTVSLVEIQGCRTVTWNDSWRALASCRSSKNVIILSVSHSKTVVFDILVMVTYRFTPWLETAMYDTKHTQTHTQISRLLPSLDALARMHV